MDEQQRVNGVFERLIRWQSNLRQSLSSHVALITAFSSGGLVFYGSILNDDKAHFGGITSICIIFSGLLFLITVVLAIFISSNRLNDNRKTLEIIRARRDKKPAAVITELEAQTDKLGTRTWKAVYWQLYLFLAACALFAIAVTLSFWHRFWP